MDFPGKNTGVGCHFLLQGIFLTQGWNPYLLHCRQIYYSWASREAQEIYKVRNTKAIAEAIWVEWEVELLWVWDPGTGLICIWIINLPLPLCAPFLGFLSVFNFLSSLALILAGFLKVQKSEFSQVPQDLVSWAQRAQSGHRERLLLTNSSNLVQWKVDF